MVRVAGLTAVAMVAFAANSLFARLALATGDMDALGYTGVRLVSGALMLAVLLSLRRKGDAGAAANNKGSWAAAMALFGYALAFSIAYVMLGAGTGALILFASVQLGILAAAVLKGDRPSPLEWAGIGVALASLAYFVSPGLVAPDPLGAALMMAAGLCWAAYSLLGRGSRSPLADTAGNFLRCLPIGVALILAGALSQRPSWDGLAYAMASGALASAMGYVIWYMALPNLSRSQAAFVQLTVPVVAAAGGVLFIGEPVTARLVLASAGILGGVALALFAAEQRRSRVQARLDAEA